MFEGTSKFFAYCEQGVQARLKQIKNVLQNSENNFHVSERNVFKERPLFFVSASPVYMIYLLCSMFWLL